MGSNFLLPNCGCVAQLVEQRSPKSPVGGSSPSALELNVNEGKRMTMTTPLSSKEKKRASYFREVQEELKKVSWTPKKELFASTKAVVIATFICGFAIYLTDLTIRQIFDVVGYVARMIFG